ncbi:MAG: ATP-dependent zinc metalloprotease FtsH [Clostridiales bacterium]|nr:ATP-dependent zinc metalloprotease FtsH [Clostridiales bacterium]
MRKNRKWLLSIIPVAAVVAAIVIMALQPKQTIPLYSDVMGYFEAGQVQEYTLNIHTGVLSARLRDGGTLTYTVPDIELFINRVEPVVTAYNTAHPESRIVFDYVQSWQNAAWLNALPYILLVAAGSAWLIIRYGPGKSNKKHGGSLMSFTKVSVGTAPELKARKTFADVAGADEEKEELRELVEFLKEPQKFNGLGARIPKGVLLIGPPGTGKTLIARAVSGEAGVPFFSISGSDFVEMYVGVGASRVRGLFEKAKKIAPCIVFIDEIDAVGRKRGSSGSGGSDEREQTLNQLLVEMDGFGADTGVIVIAATNRADILDPALLRPGRFDRQVYVGIPDIKGREAVLKVHSRKKPLSADVDLSEIARNTVGFTGADLENLLNEAALLAAKRGRKAIGMPEIEESVLKVIAGPEKKSKVISGKEKRLTAYHEAGHALVTSLLPSKKKVQQVSIIPRGRMGGFTLTPPEEDKNFDTRNDMLDQIRILLGGRAAEELVLNDISTGASNDIERATAIAHAMVTKFGMSTRLGPVKYGSEQYSDRKSSDRVSSEIDAEIQAIISDAYDNALGILTDAMDKLHAVADYLCRYEKMSGRELRAILDGEEPTGLDGLPVLS